MNKLRYKIMENKNEISDNEIESYKNFEELLKKSNNLKREIKYKGIIIKTSFALLTILSVTFLYHFKNKNTDKIATEPRHIIQENKKTLIKDPQTKETTDKINTPKQVASIQKSTTPKQKKDSEKYNTPSSTSIKKAPNKKYPGGNQAFKEAEPAGGYEELFTFLSKNLQYPKEALDKGIAGSVMVEFYINEKGKAEKIEILNRNFPELEEEAKRLITIMPAWSPALIDSKPIAARQVLPINFTIEKK